MYKSSACWQQWSLAIKKPGERGQHNDRRCEKKIKKRKYEDKPTIPDTVLDYGFECKTNCTPYFGRYDSKCLRSSLLLTYSLFELSFFNLQAKET